MSVTVQLQEEPARPAACRLAACNREFKGETLPLEFIHCICQFFPVPGHPESTTAGSVVLVWDIARVEEFIKVYPLAGACSTSCQSLNRGTERFGEPLSGDGGLSLLLSVRLLGVSCGAGCGASSVAGAAAGSGEFSVAGRFCAVGEVRGSTFGAGAALGFCGLLVCLLGDGKDSGSGSSAHLRRISPARRITCSRSRRRRAQLHLLWNLPG